MCAAQCSAFSRHLRSLANVWRLPNTWRCPSINKIAVQACPPQEANCPRPETSLSGNFVSFGCYNPNEYNDLATLFFNTQDDAIRNLYSTGTTQEYSKMALVVFFLTFYGLTIITYGLPLPAGERPCRLLPVVYSRPDISHL